MRVRGAWAAAPERASAEGRARVTGTALACPLRTRGGVATLLSLGWLAGNCDFFQASDATLLPPSSHWEIKSSDVVVGKQIGFCPPAPPLLTVEVVVSTSLVWIRTPLHLPTRPNTRLPLSIPLVR